MQGRLLHYINNIELYGQMIMDQGDYYKGKIMRNLAAEAKKRTDAFFRQDENTIRNNFPQFREDLTTLLNSQNDVLKKYRRNLATIFKNIGIALTVIGAFVVLGKLLHSRITTGRTLGFFAQPITTSEIIRNNVLTTLDEPLNDAPPQPQPRVD